MTDSNDAAAAPAQPENAGSQPASVPSPGNEQVASPAAPSSDQVKKLMQHPLAKNFLGRSIKIVAGMAILGCILLWAAITALTTMLNNALPH